MKKVINDIRETYLELSGPDKKNFWILSVAYFFILFIYPFLRATTTALYIQTYGAKATPIVEFLTVFALSLTILLYNHLQKKWLVQDIFSLTSYFSAFFFLFSYGFYLLDIKFLTYFLYIWKEIYIILLMTMYWTYVNNSLNYKQAKIFFGPISAWGSLGGIIGGFITAGILGKVSITWTIFMALVLLIFNDFLFRQTKRLQSEQKFVDDQKDLYQKSSPLEMMQGVKLYVFYIVLIVALSQFCINIANLQFNFFLEKNVTDVTSKAEYLAKIFAFINIITLSVKIFIMPFLLLKVSNRIIHLAIPLIYMGVNFLGLGLGADIFFAVAGSFILLKGMDYSCFAIVKELLYYPMSPIQKYGAKYVADIFSYRGSKALIAFFLIYVQNIPLLNFLNYIILAAWFIVVLLLFREQKRLPMRQELNE